MLVEVSIDLSVVHMHLILGETSSEKSVTFGKRIVK